MLDVNITLLFQLVNFIVTLIVLDFLLIKPVRSIIKKRRELANGILSDAETFTTEAANKLEHYETTLSKAREQAASLRETYKEKALANEHSVLETARKDAQEILRTSREETQNAIAQALKDMNTRIPDLSRMAVARLLDNTKRTPTS